MIAPKCCKDCEYFEHGEYRGLNRDFCHAALKDFFNENIDPADERAPFCPEPWDWEVKE